SCNTSAEVLSERVPDSGTGASLRPACIAGRTFNTRSGRSIARNVDCAGAEGVRKTVETVGKSGLTSGTTRLKPGANKKGRAEIRAAGHKRARPPAELSL